MPDFLILQLKRIGDAVLTAPALGALRAGFPGSRLTLVLAGAAGPLAPLFGMVDEVLTWQPGRWNAALLHRVRDRQPAVVLDYTGTDRSSLLALMSGAPVRAGYEKFAGGWLRKAACNLSCGASVRDLHTIDFHHALARAAGLGLPLVPDSGHLRLPAGLELPALPDRYCLIHPGTAREEKFWPASSWSALLNPLHAQHGLPIVLTGGDWDYERQHIAEILSGTGVPVIDLRGKLNLPQWAGVIAGARLAITVDTAAMHVASAFRIPQVALFGPTNPWHWAPRQSGAVVLRAGVRGVAGCLAMEPKQTGGRMESLSWQTVAEAVDICLSLAHSPSRVPQGI